MIYRLLLGTVLSLLSFTALAGAWGTGSFDNDDALDWVAECAESNSPSVVASAIQSANSAKYLEAPEGAVAIVAAEIVAAARGKPSPKLPTELRTWLAGQSKQQIAGLAPQARKALALVQNAQSSELPQLWGKGLLDQWLKDVRELEQRLK